MIEDNIITDESNERTVLVGLITQQQNETKANEYLDELAFLARTAGAEPENGSCRNSTTRIRALTSGRGSLRKYASMWKTTKSDL